MRRIIAPLLAAVLAVVTVATPAYGRGTSSIPFSCTYTSDFVIISYERFWEPWHYRGAVEIWTTVSGDAICTGTTLHVLDMDWPTNSGNGGSSRAWNHLDLDAPYTGSGWDYRTVGAPSNQWNGTGFGEFAGWQFRATAEFLSWEPFVIRLDGIVFQTAR